MQVGEEWEEGLFFFFQQINKQTKPEKPNYSRDLIGSTSLRRQSIEGKLKNWAMSVQSRIFRCGYLGKEV